MSKNKTAERKQINIRIEPELFNFLIQYSDENYKTMTAVIREMIVDLYKKFKKDDENKVE